MQESRSNPHTYRTPSNNLDNIDNDEELMGKPRSDEFPPLPEPQESLEDESSESQMRKVMRTEVEEFGYWDEKTKISSDRKNALVIFV